ncbi:hypothetical protein TetV_424 [Tetraselmis virus 1]|uniref:Uncharacterized protein n=1 Tax=Tetraselmis virus 1 TaxID=2060617 RepID=A0A2P0VNL7_9VIRU|nr:hypothetical protein QJ968_gp630 [Tetraselmis virus 1]AUF82506.1 hypothetical protein TetV_424 [Tetraselmis virus 1]
MTICNVCVKDIKPNELTCVECKLKFNKCINFIRKNKDTRFKYGNYYDHTFHELYSKEQRKLRIDSRHRFYGTSAFKENDVESEWTNIKKIWLEYINGREFTRLFRQRTKIIVCDSDSDN